MKNVLLISSDVRYDLMFGADFLAKSSINIKHSFGTVEWFDSKFSMQDLECLDNHKYLAMAEALKVHHEEEAIFDPDCFATTILDAKYEKVDVDDVVEQLTHLSKLLLCAKELH
jgi:hypothetical protein